jgi:diguanylate cyclase (GGDEF)-like protein
MEISSRVLQWMQYLVALLVLLTLTLLLWHRFGMERVIELSPLHPHEVSVYDDHDESSQASDQPDNSVATLEKSADALTMHCRLGRALSWPYCKFRFVTGHDDKGIDLSEFDTISLDLRYDGPMPRKVKLFVVNTEPQPSKEWNWRGSRYNELEFAVPAQGTVTVPVNLLRTADWWKDLADVPLAQTYTRLDNVTAVELSTSSVPLPAPPITMELRSIRFHGKWIAQERLLMWLVSAWVACGLIGMALGLLHFRANLAASNARLAMVETINKALELEARELADQAYTDPLTGALNRQGLRDTLLKRLQTAHCNDSLAVVFIDLDYFKRINDQHGHETGDEVLRRFAAMVRTHVRAADKLVRWGGEEFLLVCPETHLAQAIVLAEKLRTSMHAEHWPSGLAVTASFGISETQPGEDFGQAIGRADGALYRAKAGGRDRVEFA